mgnify:CR=1 FL=1
MKKYISILCLIGLVAMSPAASAKSEWREERSEHFVIYYKKAPLDFVKNVEKMAEQYYSEITEGLGFTRYQNWSYDDRAKIYIYDDQDDYVDSAKQARWSHGVASARMKEIRTFPSAHGFFDSVLPHEMGHIIFREFVGHDINLPLWLDEGVAMFQEKAKRWGANNRVRDAVNTKKFIPLEELAYMELSSSTSQETVELFYAEAASIVYYMISELGEQSFSNFCRKLKQGSTFDNALSMTYLRIHNINDLNKFWVKYLEEGQ